MRMTLCLLLLTTHIANAETNASIDESALAALVERAGKLDTDALVVWHDGVPVLERWFDGKPRRFESMSVTKSVVSMAIGRLVETGRIRSLDEPVSTWYPEWRQGRKRSITLRHVLTHTSGLQNERLATAEIYGSPDFVQLALCAEVVDPPGQKFAYNNKATNLLAGLVQRISGKRLDVLLKEELFGPLKITDIGWTLDPAGNPHAMSGLQIRPADLAKLGQVMLDRGRWQGEPLLSAEWVEEATRPSEANAEYGQLWWMIRGPEGVIGFRARGWQGQQLVVLEDQRLVVVRMREPSRVNTIEEDQRYAFPELTELARALAKRR
jgi:CubicO group peptidase (beta-lactamase class C family)